MKKYFKPIFLIFTTVILIFCAPYIKTPGTCGITVPLPSFVKWILGYDNKEISTEREGTYKNFDKPILENKISTKDATKNIKVTFIELGSLNCLPCKMMQPVIKKIKKKYPKQVKIISYDVLTKQGKTESYKYKIKVIPTQIFLDINNHEYFRHEGFFSFDEINTILQKKGVQ